MSAFDGSDAELNVDSEASEENAGGTVPKASVLPFPKLGVTLRGFEQFIANAGGEEALRGLTTTQICETYIKGPDKETFSKKLSYCEVLQLHNDDNVGVASVFVSHAWKYEFLDVYDALKTQFPGNPEVVVWFDLFSNNQLGKCR